MKLKELSELAEKLRKNVIGDPIWIKEKKAFEYTKQTIEVIIILKLLRAIQGVKSLDLLRQNSLFIDMGAIHRCVNDCVEEICFLLENYPETYEQVDKFIKGFFENKTDSHESNKTPAVKKKKIRSATIRYSRNQLSTDDLRKSLEATYKLGCGCVHADYKTIMRTYDGTSSNPSFTLLSASSNVHLKVIVQDSFMIVLVCMCNLCLTFNQKEIGIEAKKLLDESYDAPAKSPNIERLIQDVMPLLE